MSDESDPKIVSRLNKLPPYTDAQGNIVDKLPEEPTPEPQEVSQVEETPVEEPVVEEKAEETVEEAPKEEISEEEALDNSKNPERTKKYIEKLKKQNEELKKPNILESLQPQAPELPQWPAPPTTNVVPTPQQYPGLTQKQIDEAFKTVVDDQGYVDAGLLDGTLNDLLTKNKALNEELVKSREETKQVRAETQQTNKRLDDFERNEVMREVHTSFPKLNPENSNVEDEGKKFDPRLWEYVRKQMVSKWVEEATSGKINPNESKKDADRRRMLEVTAKGMGFLDAGVLNDEGEVDPSLIGMKKADKAKMEEADTAKRNINAIGASQVSQRANYQDHDTLVMATRRGEPGALAERLRKAGQ